MTKPSLRSGSLHFEVHELSMNDLVVNSVGPPKSQLVLQRAVFGLTSEEVNSVLNHLGLHLLFILTSPFIGLDYRAAG